MKNVPTLSFELWLQEELQWEISFLFFSLSCRFIHLCYFNFPCSLQFLSSLHFQFSSITFRHSFDNEASFDFNMCTDQITSCMRRRIKKNKKRIPHTYIWKFRLFVFFFIHIGDFFESADCSDIFNFSASIEAFYVSFYHLLQVCSYIMKLFLQLWRRMRIKKFKNSFFKNWKDFLKKPVETQIRIKTRWEIFKNSCKFKLIRFIWIATIFTLLLSVINSKLPFNCRAWRITIKSLIDWLQLTLSQ